MDTNAGAVWNYEWIRMQEPFLTTNGHEWTRMDVARAFQPEICCWYFKSRPSATEGQGAISPRINTDLHG